MNIAALSTIGSIAALSELDGETPDDFEERKIFITTNECGVEEVMGVLQSRPYRPRGCHIGVSGWYNYDIASVACAELLVIVDKSSSVIDFHKVSIDLLKRVKDRAEFVAGMVQKLLSCKFCLPDGLQANAAEHFYRHLIFTLRVDGKMKNLPEVLGIEACRQSPQRVIETAMDGELIRPSSWLSSDESFRKIQQLAQNGKIIPLRLDLKNCAKFEQLATILKSASIRVNSLYLSNVYDSRILEWDPFQQIDSSEESAKFKRSIHHLIDDETLVLDTVTEFTVDLVRETRKTKRMEQALLLGKDPVTKREYDPELVRSYFEDPKELFPSAPRLKAHLC